MLINFTKDKAGVLNIVVPVPVKAGDSPEKRVHRSPKIISLVPGINDIPDKTWNKIKDTERVASYVAQGYLVTKHAEKVVSKKEGVPDKELTKTEYKALKADEQVELINECELLKTLKGWKSGTKEAAKSVLNDKIDRLKNPEKYVDKD